MAADLKLEIIYYRTPSDFEMEFNLCGCCSVRLLTSKPTIRKELLQQLARAVERSRAVMIVGQLYGEEGLIPTVSKAVGLPLEISDDVFSVAQGGDRSLPQGAVPIIDSSGDLAGCIIESGPQAIILMSEDRPLRHKILKETIYDYLKVMSIADKSSALSASLYRGKHSKPADEAPVEPETEHEGEKMADEPIADTQPVTEEKSKNFDDIVMSSSKYDPESDAEKEYTPRRKPRRHPVLTTFICIFSAILLAVAGMAVYYFVYEPLAAENVYSELKNENAYSLLEKNDDFYAVMSVTGKDISYPVVITNDNNYYSTHLFNGCVNRFGTPRILNSAISPNIVVHGLCSGGGLDGFTDYLDKRNDGFFASSPTISLQTADNTEYYKVFSVFDATNSSFEYDRSFFIDDTERTSYITEATAADLLGTGVTPTENCSLLTIICEEEDRTVVIVAFKEIKSETEVESDRQENIEDGE